MPQPSGGTECWGQQNYSHTWVANRTGAEICRGDGIAEVARPTSPLVALSLSYDSASAALWTVSRDRGVRVREELPQEGPSRDRLTIPRRWSPRWIALTSAGQDARQLGTGGGIPNVGFFPRENGCVIHPLGDVTCKLGFPSDWGTERRWKRAYEHGCALLGDGRVACWGYNRFGQAPAAISFPARVRELAVGKDHGCALLEDERVACWGGNPDGDLGLPRTPCAAGCAYQSCDGVPHVVAGLEGVVHVRTGGASTCAVTRDGRLVCWDTFGDRLDECDVKAL